MFRRRRKTNPYLGFLIGGVVGSAAALVMAPTSGRETRNNISSGANRILNKAIEQKNIMVKNAMRTAEGLTDKAEVMLRKATNFAEGKYNSSIKGLELEIKSIRNGIQAAANSYTSEIQRTGGTASPFGNEVIVNEMFTDFEDEKLPKNEGMGRRQL